MIKYDRANPFKIRTETLEEFIGAGIGRNEANELQKLDRVGHPGVYMPTCPLQWLSMVGAREERETGGYSSAIRSSSPPPTERLSSSGSTFTAIDWSRSWTAASGSDNFHHRPKPHQHRDRSGDQQHPFHPTPPPSCNCLSIFRPLFLTHRGCLLLMGAFPQSLPVGRVHYVAPPLRR